MQAAFDWVDRALLWRSIKARINAKSHPGILHLLSKIETIYKYSQSFLKTEGIDESFSTSSGVLQGSIEGPKLFCLVFDLVLRQLEEEAKEAGIGLRLKHGIPSTCSDRGMQRRCKCHGELYCLLCAFADDLVVMTEKAEDLQRVMDILIRILRSYGLVLSVTKTKSMILNFQGNESLYPTKLIKAGDTFLENVKKFRYLGTMIYFNLYKTGQVELEYRKQCAIGAIKEHEKYLMNQFIPLKDRREYFDSMVRSQLTLWLLGIGSIGDG